MATIAVFILVVLLATGASAYAGAVRSAGLRRKFEELGEITGRSVDEVLRHVGKPNTRVPAGQGREVLVWRRINFQVALRFTGGVCDGIDYNG